jgi:hypothetical protein
MARFVATPSASSLLFAHLNRFSSHNHEPSSRNVAFTSEWTQTIDFVTIDGSHRHSASKTHSKRVGSAFPNLRLGEHKVPMSQFYPSQTEILEDRTNISEHVSREALFKGVGTRFGLQNVEKCFPGKRVLKCLFGLPKSPFGEHKFRDHLREYGLGTHIGPTMHQATFKMCATMSRRERLLETFAWDCYATRSTTSHAPSCYRSTSRPRSGSTD